MAIETVPQAPVQSAPAYVALSLGGDDYIHLLELLRGARDHLPTNSDADLSRACLRAADDFLMAKEDDPDRE